MIRFFGALIIFLGAIASGTAAWALSSSESETVSVRLRPLNGNISVTGENLKVRGGGRLLFSQVGYQSLKLNYDGGSWSLRDESKALSREFAMRSIDIELESARVDLRPVSRKFRVVGRSAGRADLVGLLNLEDYVEGVVASEVPRDWPMEALKAQSVAARSFALARLGSRAAHRLEERRGWIFESSTMDQVFDQEKSHSRSLEAVEKTRGEFLEAGGSVVAAHYHSDCGGATDEPSAVWGGGPELGTARDSSCALRPKTKWKLVLSRTRLQRELESKAIVPKGFQMASLAIAARSAGGRAMELLLQSVSGQSIQVTGEMLREALGYNELRSTLFDVRKTSDGGLEFSGRGFGHGSGMCQWGARSLAKSGKSYVEILRHYYPKLHISKPSVLAIR